MFRLAGQPPGDWSVAAIQFSDVGVTHPFAQAIGWMASEGISTGFGDGTFRPTLPVTRQALAAFMQRIGDEGEPTELLCRGKPGSEAETLLLAAPSQFPGGLIPFEAKMAVFAPRWVEGSFSYQASGRIVIDGSNALSEMAAIVGSIWGFEIVAVDAFVAPIGVPSPSSWRLDAGGTTFPIELSGFGQIDLQGPAIVSYRIHVPTLDVLLHGGGGVGQLMELDCGSLNIDTTTVVGFG